MADESDFRAWETDYLAWNEPDDDHRGIPRDATGKPVFLILPPTMRAEYERKVEACWAGWQATGDPAAPMEALALSLCYRQEQQFWFVEAACSLMSRRRTKRYITRRYNATIKWMRYAAVRDAVARGLGWLDAYHDAEDKLAKTPAAAKWPSMKADYDEVIGDLREGRSALYWYTPKMPKLEEARKHFTTK